MNRRFVLFCGFAFALAAMACPAFANNATISVNADSVLADRQNQPRPIGINLNNLMDADSKRPEGSRTMAATLTDMKPTFVRWPGGEKADNYLWAVPPTWQPATHRPALIDNWPGDKSAYVQDGVYRSNVQNFDDFMQLRQQVGFEPVIVVAYDSQFFWNPDTRPSREQLLQSAEEWVRYANISKGYNIRYWEIGNESDMSGSYNGRTPDMTTYANDVREFSQRMKAIDPKIKIGLNASTQANYVTLLEQIHEHVDFLVAHPYPVSSWGSYEHYRTGTRNLVGLVSNAANALDSANIPQASKDRITIGSSETNTIDWSDTNQWASSNDTGRGLVAFDLMGQQMSHPKAEYVTFWNTRWVNDDAKSTVYNALRPDNQYYAQGRAVAIWGQFMQERMISASSNLSSVIPFATHSPVTGCLVVFLLNKELTAATATVNLSSYAPATAARAWQYRGTSPTDATPVWEQLADVSVSGSSLSLSVPPLSITVLELSPATPLPALWRRRPAHEQTTIVSSACGSLR